MLLVQILRQRMGKWMLSCTIWFPISLTNCTKQLRLGPTYGSFRCQSKFPLKRWEVFSLRVMTCTIILEISMSIPLKRVIGWWRVTAVQCQNCGAIISISAAYQHHAPAPQYHVPLAYMVILRVMDATVGRGICFRQTWHALMVASKQNWID